MIIPLVMSGGAGTRLWPLSRADVPKQFHALIGAETMFARTLARLAPTDGNSGRLDFAPPVVVFNARHLALVQDELAAAGMPPRALILEPMGRNTAPAVAAAIIASATADTQDLMLMLPADHLIADTPAFHRAIEAGSEAARDGALVTFGIVPDRPETGFGYIRRGARDGASYAVEAFVEKPDRETAEQYLATGNYSWNAGIFLFRTDVMAAELRRQRPELWSGAEEALIAPAEPDSPWRLDAEKFAMLKGESLDYAVMEGAARVNVVPVEMGWDDIGSWSQLHAASTKDEAGNALTGDVITVDTANSYVRADHGLVTTVGISDLIVVRTGDTTLVAAKSASQDVKAIVDELKAKGRFEADTTPAVGAPLAPAAARRDEVRRWLFATALPFWSSAAIDPTSGHIAETLNLDATHLAPACDQTLRLRVAARQLYTFAHARQLGFTGDTDRVIEAAFTYLTRHGWHPDGGFIHLTDRAGHPRDTRRDTYDHAFALLAFAHMAKATGRSDAQQWFEKTAAFIEDHLRDDTPGLYLEGLPATTPRRANPHMHLLEAWLAAFELDRRCQASRPRRRHRRPLLRSLLRCGNLDGDRILRRNLAAGARRNRTHLRTGPSLRMDLASEASRRIERHPHRPRRRLPQALRRRRSLRPQSRDGHDLRHYQQGRPPP